LICLTGGVLETQFLHGKSDDCVAYVDKCVPIQAHRRLGEETWQDSLDSFIGRVAWPRFLNTATAGTGSTTGTGSTAGHGSTAAHGSSAGIAGCGHVGQSSHFGNHDIHLAEVNLTYISVGILTVFFIEQLLLIIELKSEYCKPMFILDLFVISSSLALELFVILSGKVGSGSGLLVMARTWRFARVGHGVMAAQEEMEAIEEDESFTSMAVLWAEIPDERWTNIAKRMSAADLFEQPLNEAEHKVVEELGKSVHVTMRVLAFSRVYQLHREKKLGQSKGGSSMAMGEVLGKTSNTSL